MATARDYVKLHFIVFLWGFTAILGKLIEIPSLEMVFYRCLLAAVGMLVFIFYTRAPLKIPPVEIFRLLLTGCIVSIHWITFFGSARVSNVSVSLVGLATASLWTSILEPLSSGKKVKPIEVLLGGFVLVGIAIIFSVDFQYKLGFLLGVAAGFGAALFSVINSKMIARVPAATITFYEMTGACLATAAFFPVYAWGWADNGTLSLSPSATDWLYISILAFVCTVYAFTVMTELMKRISVFFIQLTINLEPLYGMIMAVMLFKEKEKMSMNFYIGSMIILSAVISYPLIKRYGGRSTKDEVKELR